MTSADSAVLQSEILNAYYADNAKKLHKTVDRVLCRFGGLSGKDTDDFYSLANEVFADGKFLEWFVNGGSGTTINGAAWETLNENKATRDSGVVHGKIDYLAALMGQYFKETRKVA